MGIRIVQQARTAPSPAVARQRILQAAIDMGIDADSIDALEEALELDPVR